MCLQICKYGWPQQDLQTPTMNCAVRYCRWKNITENQVSAQELILASLRDKILLICDRVLYIQIKKIPRAEFLVCG